MPTEPAPGGHRISAWIFPRLLGLVYLSAFLSFGFQARGLVGPDGILPLSPYLRAAAAELPHPYWNLPTLSWLDVGQPPLVSLAAVGCAVSVLLVLGLAPFFCLALLWLLYLSLVTDGQVFMGYQWDSLLLESGLAALLMSSVSLRARLAGAPEPPRLARWLCLWILFKLILGSGLVKLASGDPHWRNLSALSYHTWTQPLPLWTSWYLAQVPPWCLRLACLGVLLVELGAPFLMLLPATRKAAAIAVAALMVVIAGTGNYGFFNLLTLVLCLPLLRDGDWPARLRHRLAAGSEAGPRRRMARPLRSVLAAVLALLGAAPFAAQCGVRADWPAWLMRVEEGIAPLRSVNTYGLFAEMTTQRHEIVLEGSDNGRDWLDYGFPWKPGDPLRRPGLVAPFQPRLDWQLWFAALGTREDNPWFDGLCLRLLQGSPDVLGLLAQDPFGGRAPVYLRARLYDYRFADTTTHRATGAWWQRTLVGDYMPAVSLTAPPPVSK